MEKFSAYPTQAIVIALRSIRQRSHKTLPLNQAVIGIPNIDPMLRCVSAIIMGNAGQALEPGHVSMPQTLFGLS
jgi:hypothetical protein